MAPSTASNRSSDQLSEEELRAYVAQLREAPVADMLAQAYTMLGAWAEAKLGRRDARPLIDAMSGLVEKTAAALPADLAKQMSDGIAQLQMAQVQAEQQQARQQEMGTAGAPTASGQQASQPPGAQRPSDSDAGQSAQRLTDRLWIPGRDPKPPRRT